MLPGGPSVPKQRLERFSLRFIVDVGGAAFKFLHLAHKSSEYTAVQAHYDTQNDQRMSSHEYPRDQIVTNYTLEQESIKIGHPSYWWGSLYIKGQVEQFWTCLGALYSEALPHVDRLRTLS